jgi:Tfp pilus assembly protein PilE
MDWGYIAMLVAAVLAVLLIIKDQSYQSECRRSKELQRENDRLRKQLTD